MTITVKFFASLKERTGLDAAEVECADAASVLDVWREATGADALPGNVLAAVNFEYVPPGHAVRDGDEVAFFPPVTGG